MKESRLLWRMVLRRKTATLLVVLFAAVVTAFLLIYPRLMEDTQKRLDEAYDLVEVSGWMINTKEYSSPEIPLSDYLTLAESGYLSECTAHTDFHSGHAVTEEELNAWQTDPVFDDNGPIAGTKLSLDAVSSLAACEELYRLSDSIQWWEGYSAEALRGGELTCILSENCGYAPGDTLTLLHCPAYLAKEQTTVELMVIGTFPYRLSDIDGVMPLNALASLWDRIYPQGKLTVRDVSFTVKENRDLDALKNLLVEQKYDGSGNGIRAAIDDRILQGTIAPIKSTLSLLEGLQRFFFGVVAVIGFFLCFLLARGRKSEYAIMRMLGESLTRITAKVLAEQLVLCAIGVALGTAVVVLTGLGRMELAICGGILLCYALGAAVAVALTVRVNVMESLRDKE